MANEDYYFQCLRDGICIAHEELEVGGHYEFTYYDAYEGVIEGMTEDKQDIMIRITKVDTEDVPMYSVGDCIHVYDISIKKRIHHSKEGIV